MLFGPSEQERLVTASTSDTLPDDAFPSVVSPHPGSIATGRVAGAGNEPAVLEGRCEQLGSGHTP
jgi:hypothetical protein